jgi:hypothetical protein
MTSPSYVEITSVNGFRNAQLWDVLGFMACAAFALAFGVLGIRILMPVRKHTRDRSAVVQRAASKAAFYFGCTGIFVGVLCSATFYTWLGAYELQLSETSLRYCSLFSGCRSISVHDIESAKYAVGWSRAHPYWPIIRVEIRSRNKAQLPVIINLKVFSSKDRDFLTGWLNTNVERLKP